MSDIQGKTVLVMGGWGLVGRAICRQILRYNPDRLIVCSMQKWEAEDACERLEIYKKTLQEDESLKITTRFVPVWGDIFSRNEHLEFTLEDKNTVEYLESVIADTFDDLSKIDLTKSFLYKMLLDYCPHIVIDAVNTATAVAYRDVYKSVIEMRKAMAETTEALQSGDVDALKNAAASMVDTSRTHLNSIYLPRLIRHVQLLYKGMQAVKTQVYIKIGTTGTGGMGLNIPYTHSEEKPSQVLLSKSAVGGAHSLLLYLMSKTPEMATTMEFKPAAAIAWKRIDKGEIRKRGVPIKLCDNKPENAFPIENKLALNLTDDRIECSDDTMNAVYIDTGENGLFSAGEFAAITTTGQMEYITPEEIAGAVIEEIKGGNSGYDILNSLSNTVMRSTYRAGFMREHAVQKLRELEIENDADSVAFEILGPPRLSKLLYEAYLIKRIYRTPEAVAAVDATRMSEDFQRLVTVDSELRRRIISIGIPILLPDGTRLLRGSRIAIPPYRGENLENVTPEQLNGWADDGWIDLRASNMTRWKERMALMQRLIQRYDWALDGADTSSTYNRKDFLVKDRDGNLSLNIGEVVGWIFNVEEAGARKEYDLPPKSMNHVCQ